MFYYNKYLGSEIDTQLHNGLDFAIRKPLSSASLERIINAWTSKQPEMKNPAHVGMTKEDFIDMVNFFVKLVEL